MRFLVDECTGPAVARWLREQKHEVFSVYEEARGAEDMEKPMNIPRKFGLLHSRLRLDCQIAITP